MWQLLGDIAGERQELGAVRRPITATGAAAIGEPELHGRARRRGLSLALSGEAVLVLGASNGSRGGGDA